ncbi:MAG: hypothetical protein AAFX00_10465 [Pseudomonadota bacterium]
MRPVLLLFLMLAACTEFPELDAKATERARSAPYPQLSPIDDIIFGGPELRIDEDTQDLIKWRGDRLKDTAKAIRRADGSDESRNDIARTRASFEPTRPEPTETLVP